jgi:hypothetical protein
MFDPRSLVDDLITLEAQPRESKQPELLAEGGIALAVEKFRKTTVRTVNNLVDGGRKLVLVVEREMPFAADPVQPESKSHGISGFNDWKKMLAFIS